jgi:hypothetical protein
MAKNANSPSAQCSNLMKCDLQPLERARAGTAMHSAVTSQLEKRGSVWMGAFHPSNNPNSFGPSIYLGLHQTCYLRYGFMIWGLRMRIRIYFRPKRFFAIYVHLCQTIGGKRSFIGCSCNISAKKACCQFLSQRTFYRSKNIFQNIAWYFKFRKKIMINKNIFLQIHT